MNEKQSVTWGALFDYIVEAIDPREEDPNDPDSFDDDCEDTFKSSLQFCREHGVDFGTVYQVFMETGAYCDCTALYGSSMCIKHEVGIGSADDPLVDHLTGIRWHDLFEYVNEKCNFHEEVPGDSKSVKWKCSNKLEFVEEFCKERKLDFGFVEKRLQRANGYCDCEVILNAVRYINPEERIMLPSFAPPSQASA